MADKCVFCNPDDPGWFNVSPAFDVDFGKFGTYELSLSTCEGKMELQLDNGEGHELFTHDIKINYCPFCGRKMGEPRNIINKEM